MADSKYVYSKKQEVTVVADDDEAYQTAMELAAKGPVTIKSKSRSWFHVNDFDEAVELITQAVINQGSCVVEEE